jgi:hypothetical protein
MALAVFYEDQAAGAGGSRGLLYALGFVWRDRPGDPREVAWAVELLSNDFPWDLEVRGEQLL